MVHVPDAVRSLWTSQNLRLRVVREELTNNIVNFLIQSTFLIFYEELIKYFTIKIIGLIYIADPLLILNVIDIIDKMPSSARKEMHSSD